MGPEVAPMSLGSGTRLGIYEILGLLCAGGIGEVCKPCATGFDRTVATKVLLAHLKADCKRRSRVEREVLAIATLAHSHTCTLDEIGPRDATTHLVMKHLASENHADCFAREPLPLAPALALAQQSADALDAVHKDGCN